METTTGMSSKLPSTSTFSFTAPFPPSSAFAKQRRVSLALPSSPRLFPAWNFRDDTGLGVHSADSSGLAPEKKGKMRRIATGEDRADDESSQSPQPAPTQPEKKPRKKWTIEETNMLVAGCNKVRSVDCFVARRPFIGLA